MKYNLNIGGMMQSCDSELPLTHALIGHRSREWNAPSEEVLERAARNPRLLTPEEGIAYLVWSRAITVEGKYATLALAWAESAEAAESLRSRFTEPEWDQDSLQVVEVE